MKSLIRVLIQRPIAVLTVFSVLAVFGSWFLFRIPVSLLPAIDVPQVVVKIHYPNTPALAIEENIIKVIRERLGTVYQLRNLESISTNHGGTLYLTFDYGTKMDLAFIEVNEKIDGVLDILPKDLARPQVVRINTSDVPIAHLQIIPTHESDHLMVSELTEKVIKKRIEQLNGVSLVDINGKKDEIIEVTPIAEMLRSVNLSAQDLVVSVQQSNIEFGSLSVRDGHYRYFVKLTNNLATAEDVANIPVKINNNMSIPLKELAGVRNVSEVSTGHHLFNGVRGLVITIHKQPQARMNELLHEINESVGLFRKDYPNVKFEVTQDQSFILNAGIGNLYQAIIFGSLCCIALLFIFVRNLALPLLMCIAIPVALLITFTIFHLFNVSFNIISLSGLDLGIGMLIDNSIVVLDSITRKRKNGMSIEDSCAIGVNEVAGPVLSAVLTSIAVYAPLIYLSGLGGALVYDQAIALTISLGVSLLISIFLNPVLYKLLLAKSIGLKDDTRIYEFISLFYHRVINLSFRYKYTFLFSIVFIMVIGFGIALWLPIKTLPLIQQTEGIVAIDWNEPIDVNENEQRINHLMKYLKMYTSEWEADIGLKQFLLNIDDNSIQKAQVYYRCFSSEHKIKADETIQKYLYATYPQATFTVGNAPNAFTQLFEDKSPFFEARFRVSQRGDSINYEAVERKLTEMTERDWQKGLGLITEQNIEMIIDVNKLVIYNIPYENVRSQLDRLFGSSAVADVKRFGKIKSIHFRTAENDIQRKLQTYVSSIDGVCYPLGTFIRWSLQNDFRYVTSDNGGQYMSLILQTSSSIDIEELQEQIRKLCKTSGLSVEFKGLYFNSRKLFQEMIVIFVISSLLLYVILAVQFESIIYPILIMLTMPLGIAGAMLALLMNGGSLDIMAAIGFIVVLGIIVDDPILKIETINRLRRQNISKGMNASESLTMAIHEAGEICLKPVLLTSLTTCLALIPILFMPGIGADLQKPMVWVVLGGLTIGTCLTLSFVPLTYWLIAKRKIDVSRDLSG